MRLITSATVVGTTARANDTTLFASLELGKSKWVVTINSPGSEKFSKHGRGCRRRRPADLLSRSRAKAEQRCGARIRVIVIEEAGLDGFSNSSLAHRRRDREPRGRCGFDRRRASPSAAQDRCDRRRDVGADADGLGSRRAARLFDGSRAQPGRRGSPAADARARHAAEGTHSAYQSGQGPAHWPRHPGLQPASARSFRTARGAANRGRP